MSQILVYYSIHIRNRTKFSCPWYPYFIQIWKAMNKALSFLQADGFRAEYMLGTWIPIREIFLTGWKCLLLYSFLCYKKAGAEPGKKVLGWPANNLVQITGVKLWYGDSNVNPGNRKECALFWVSPSNLARMWDWALLQLPLVPV